MSFGKRAMKRKNSLLSVWAKRAALSLLLLLLVAALSLIPVVRDSEMRLTDTFFRLAPPPAQRSGAVLVLIGKRAFFVTEEFAFE